MELERLKILIYGLSRLLKGKDFLSLNLQGAQSLNTITYNSRLTPKKLQKKSSTILSIMEDKGLSWDNPVLPIDAENNSTFFVKFFGG